MPFPDANISSINPMQFFVHLPLTVERHFCSIFKHKSCDNLSLSEAPREASCVSRLRRSLAAVRKFGLRIWERMRLFLAGCQGAAYALERGFSNRRVSM